MESMPDTAKTTVSELPPSPLNTVQPLIGLLATTESSNCISAVDHQSATGTRSRREWFYRSAQWTADGTTILASSSDNAISAFVLPEDLLAPRNQACHLKPQSRLVLPEPAYAVASSPHYSLADPISQTVLVCSREHPIQLYHVFPNPGYSLPLCSYKLVRHETEAYITVESLLWTSPGTHFLTGSANRLDYFDISRTGSDGPILTIPTIPSKRHLSKGGGVGMKGTVSTLASQNLDTAGSSLVAAGTWSRWIGLYDLTRTNKVIANWSIKGAAAAGFGIDIGGNGIVQTIWSPCGRYLAINERKAAGILVYDIRGTGQPVNLLVDRTATSQQRLSCDVFPGSSAGPGGFEVWAGTQDGDVLVFEGVGGNPGPLEKSWQWPAHESPVGSTAVHPSGSVVVTCSGAWVAHGDHEIETEVGLQDGNGEPSLASTRISESSLKVWSVGSGATDEAEQSRQ